MNDYLQLSDGDLDLSNGDLQITESTEQHQRDLLISDKGHIREKPEAGIGAINFMIDNNAEELFRATRKEFTADGMKVKKLRLDPSTNNLEVQASYEKD